MNSLFKTVLTAGVLLDISSGGYILAAEKQEALVTEEGDVQQMEEVVVTAQKREKNPQDVPVSMDVFYNVRLEDATIRSTDELIKLSPNVFVRKTHIENALVIRGISSFSSSTYSPAGFYVDDVNYPLHYMQNVGLFDVERVEILKGPQGT